MSRIIELDNITRTMVSGDVETIKLTRAYVLQSFTLNCTVNHTNTSIISADVTPLTFIKQVIKNLRFEAGAGSDIINLDGFDLCVRQMLDTGTLVYDIDKTTGESVSTFSLFVSVYNMRGINPKDTMLNTLNYEHINIIPTIGDFDSFTASTLNNVVIDVAETHKSGVSPLTLSSGKTAPLKNRKPLTVVKSFSSDETNFTIPLPSRSLITSITLYCTDDKDKIIETAINKASVKVIQNLRFVAKTKNLNDRNRVRFLKDKNDSNFNGIYHLDLAQGEEAQGINTSNSDENYGEVILNLTHSGSNPKITALFETIELQ